MRFAIFSFLLALLAAYAMAVAPLRSVIISYPNETPQDVVDSACDAIENAVRIHDFIFAASRYYFYGANQGSI